MNLHAPLAIADKTRAAHEERMEKVRLIGDVADCFTGEEAGTGP